MQPPQASDTDQAEGQGGVASGAQRGSWPGFASGAVALAFLGVVALGVAVTHRLFGHLDPVDLRVYRIGGLIAEHARPWYDPHRSAPLYDWPGYRSLRFTYPPFAAMAFTAATVLPLTALEYTWIAANVAALLIAIWITLGMIGWPGETAGPSHVMASGDMALRAALTLIVGLIAFWSEPVLRTVLIGQVELILMALILWDMCQPDRRWWKGAGVGVAAGIKLVPLIFILYLLLTRRFRQGAMAAGVFLLTVAVGFAGDWPDSSRWWFSGLFARAPRAGFVGWGGNQSLRALITRLAGSVAAGQWPWVAAAMVAAVVGLATAVLLDRAGHRLVAILAVALTGILCSPISWDHHWVWVVPALPTALGYAMRSSGLLRWAFGGLAGLIAAVFYDWPVSLWGKANGAGGFTLGLIWVPPSTDPWEYFRLGDRPWFAEYHWHGAASLLGNSYALTGIGLLAVLASASVWLVRQRPVAHK